MLLFKTVEETCDMGCPYYVAPALDLEKEYQIHTCKKNYDEQKDISRLLCCCPLFNIEDVFEDFLNSNKGIFEFVEEDLL